MATGDNETTAICMAKEAGILDSDWARNGKDDYTVLSGKQFRQIFEPKRIYNDGYYSEVIGNLESFQKVTNQLKVLARTSTNDKYFLEMGLQQLDHVVAMTGDGCGDGYLLKAADVGFSLGIAGTSSAK